MDVDERKEIIKAINEIRMELGLSPYLQEYLENKELEELRALLREYIKISEEERKKPKIKLERKIPLIFIPFLLVVVFFIFTSNKSNLSIISENQPLLTNSENQSLEYLNATSYTLLSLDGLFSDENGNYILVLRSGYPKNITLEKIKVDESYIEWELIAGELPLSHNSIVYLRLLKKCDGKNHTMKIETDIEDIGLELKAC